MAIPWRVTSLTTMFLVKDVRRTANWYHEVLDFHIGPYLEDEGGTAVFVILVRNGYSLQLSKSPDGAARSNRDTNSIAQDLYLMVDDVLAAFGSCESVGALFYEELTTRPYGMREFVLEDPDGHAVAVGQ